MVAGTLASGMFESGSGWVGQTSGRSRMRCTHPLSTAVIASPVSS